MGEITQGRDPITALPWELLVALLPASPVAPLLSEPASHGLRHVNLIDGKLNADALSMCSVQSPVLLTSNQSTTRPSISLNYRRCNLPVEETTCYSHIWIQHRKTLLCRLFWCDVSCLDHDTFGNLRLWQLSVYFLFESLTKTQVLKLWHVTHTRGGPTSHSK